MVAGYACADYVRPIMSTAAGAGSDVVQSQLRVLLPAVLAGEIVPVEYRSSGEASAHERPLDHVFEPYYRGDWENLRYCMNAAATVFQ